MTPIYFISDFFFPPPFPFSAPSWFFVFNFFFFLGRRYFRFRTEATSLSQQLTCQETRCSFGNSLSSPLDGIEGGIKTKDKEETGICCRENERKKKGREGSRGEKIKILIKNHRPAQVGAIAALCAQSAFIRWSA